MADEKRLQREKQLGRSEGLKEASKIMQEVYDLIGESLDVINNLRMVHSRGGDLANAAHAEVLSLRGKAFDKRMSMDNKSFKIFMDNV